MPTSPPSSEPTGPAPRDLDLYDIAFLSGGGRRVAETALITLRDRAVIQARGTWPAHVFEGSTALKDRRPARTLDNASVPSGLGRALARMGRPWTRTTARAGAMARTTAPAVAAGVVTESGPCRVGFRTGGAPDRRGPTRGPAGADDQDGRCSQPRAVRVSSWNPTAVSAARSSVSSGVT